MPAAPSKKRSGLQPARASVNERVQLLQKVDCPRADALLHELIALVCREHVTSWYSAISRDPERAFVRRVSEIIVHVVRELERRLLLVDLVELATVDLPSLLARHCQDWHGAVARAGTAHAHNLTAEALFDQTQPHLAITFDSSSAQCTVDKTYLRTLVDALLRLLLPPEDYEAETERLIVREVVVNVVLGAVLERTAQPWMIHDLLSRHLPSLAAKPRSQSNSKMFGIGSRLLSAAHDFSSALFAQAKVDKQTRLSLEPVLDMLREALPPSPALGTAAHYASLLSVAFGGLTSSVIRRVFEKHVLTNDMLCFVLSSSKDALFPDGHPPPKRPDPDVDEQDRMRDECEKRLSALLSERLASTLVGQGVEPAGTRLAQYILEPFSTRTANVHLIVLAIDLVVGKVFPELLD